MFGADYFAKKVIEYAFLFLSLQEKEYGFIATSMGEGLAKIFGIKP